MDLIERVARAMCDGDWDAKTFNETMNGDEPEDQREYWRGKARAAIIAARDFGSVPAGVASLAVETARHDKTGEVLVWHVWTGMIDAALSEQAKPLGR